MRATTADGRSLALERFGDGPRAVVFAHGGGQTRHAWEGAARAVAAAGWTAWTFDLRGHGDSDRAPDGVYTLDGFVADVAAVVAHAAMPCVLVGASLGGAAMLVYCGAQGDRVAGLVLVDIGVRARDEGVERIVGFMARHVDGFDSLEAAAEAVAAYAPGRGRSVRPEGLRKNLREDADGRFRWHWDPQLLANFDVDQVARNARVHAALESIARAHLPFAVVHGRHSDVLDHATAEETARLGGGSVISVGGAAHMVAGDANDAFIAALAEFLHTLPSP